ncbi:MAG: NAD-dependent epimerase/dehydratase family protein [Bacteroidota bacterium]|nr:NAD-dependent epimerase/dehydratase family protein [Bacteroidota bacterium]
MKIKAIIFGATGMVGEGVLHECLNHPEVESVLVINRKPCGVQHNKLKEIIVKDLQDISELSDQICGYNACYFCAGVSSVGMKEPEYRQITYDLTMTVANFLVRLNPEMVFCYISGLGTDSSEKGRLMWARIKGKTENDLMKLPFKAAYMFRPGFIQPTKGLKNAYKIYKVLTPFFPLFEALFPSQVCKLSEIGNSMINVTLNGSEIKILDCKDIRRLGK